MQYREFDNLTREHHLWTRNEHKVDRMRELYYEMKAPTPCRIVILNLIERGLGLDLTSIDNRASVRSHLKK